MPGIPGPALGTVTDHIAALFQGYLVFPTRGFWRMGVSSDDGFRVSEGFAPLRQVLHLTGNGIDRDVGATVSKKSFGNGGFGAELPITPINAHVFYVISQNY